MKKRTFSVLILPSLLALAFLISSCDNSTTEPTQTTAVRPASNFRAYSASSTSIGLKWSASLDENSSAVADPAYRISIRDSVGTSLEIQAAKGRDSAVVTGLVEGRVYTFTLKVNPGTNATSTDSVMVRWAPASRFNTSGTLPIDVFETASSTFPSGLDIFSSTAGGPNTLSLLSASNSLIDLFVHTDTTTTDLLIRSASLSMAIATPKTTLFSTVSTNADNLDDPQIAPPGASSYSTLEIRVSGSTSGATTGKIFYGRTQENNYFRLLVTRNSTSLVFGSSPDRALRFRISYQSVTGVPFAKPINPEPY